ncbi:TVP38/TMEM64 family membrane protein slr0305 [Camellia lanceoleosa]|uniref:TVP38/TMEM64 family membrane protein slr0305 n=1 Tax=Camellia lanceoleosa TaxID=1840588 RepID=A0ACC0I5Y0_9ERIC|nr:TVP38/TMEM64 family membrane protein slr0305 [Camellia lanceoleosa]
MGNGSRRSLSVGRWGKVGAVVVIVGVLKAVVSKQYGRGWNKEAALQALKEMSDRLGMWAIPAYVGLHTLSLALCIPYAVFFEAGASFLFGFFPAVLCVFSAKLLGSSLSFWIGRLVFRNSSWAMEWAQRNKYFRLLSKGVEQDGWRFVLLARTHQLASLLVLLWLQQLGLRNLSFALLPLLTQRVVREARSSNIRGINVSDIKLSRTHPILHWT